MGLVIIIQSHIKIISNSLDIIIFLFCAYHHPLIHIIKYNQRIILLNDLNL